MKKDLKIVDYIEVLSISDARSSRNNKVSKALLHIIYDGKHLSFFFITLRDSLNSSKPSIYAHFIIILFAEKNIFLDLYVLLVAKMNKKEGERCSRARLLEIFISLSLTVKCKNGFIIDIPLFDINLCCHFMDEHRFVFCRKLS